MNLALNLGSQSLITHNGSLNQLNTCLRYNWAVPSAVISSLQGMKTDALVQSWLVMVRRESYPWDLGSLVMKSNCYDLAVVIVQLGLLGVLLSSRDLVRCTQRRKLMA